MGENLPILVGLHSAFENNFLLTQDEIDSIIKNDDIDQAKKNLIKY